MAEPMSTNDVRSNKRSAQDWANKFNEHIANQRQSIFDLGDDLLAAREELDTAEFHKAIEMSGLKSLSNVLNYTRVAESKLLRSPKVYKHLPTSKRALIHLAAWNELELDTSISEGALTPSATRDQLSVWRERYRLRNGADPLTETESDPDDTVIVGHVRTNAGSWNPAQQEKLLKVYQKMAAEIGLEDTYLTLSGNQDKISPKTRQDSIFTRLVGVFVKFPVFKSDPFFKRYWREDDKLIYDDIYGSVRSIGQHISTEDYLKVHEALRFTQADWEYLGVTDPGSSTLTKFFE